MGDHRASQRVDINLYGTLRNSSEMEAYFCVRSGGRATDRGKDKYCYVTGTLVGHSSLVKRELEALGRVESVIYSKTTVQ